MSEQRKFNVADAIMLSYAGVVSANLGEDLPAFKAFDSTFFDDYPKRINDSIRDIKSIRTDNVVIDEMTELTEIVNATLSECNTAYKTLRFFVKKAFADSKPVQNQFGTNDIEKVRKNVPKMVVFMQDLKGMVQKYKAELIAAGCNEAVLDSIGPLCTKLNKDNIKQEQFKKERGVITSERVDKLNELYDLLQPVSEIAHIIFEDASAQLAKYALPTPKSSNNSEADLIVS